MTPSRWREIERVYNAALELPSAERAAFVAATCAGNEQLRAEVELLLAQSSSKTGILDKPAWETDATVTVIAAGTQLGPYRIEGPLGAGGMGEVFRAVDSRLGRPVAIKISKERFTERFEREERAISSLNHPHICTLYDVGPNYLVMELVEGETLAARLKRGKVSLQQTFRFGSQIADALAEAHSKGITHRDLKPSNIMIAKSGVKVLDFGLAKSQCDETLTAANAVMGTPAYMAPEQREGRTCDARTDIYSLGLILCEMATGKGTERGQPLGLQSLPAPLVSIVDRCLYADPDDRWQSAKDLKTVLEWAGKPAEAVEVKPLRPAKSWVRWAGWLAAGILLVYAVSLTLSKAPEQTLDAGRIERVTFDPGQASSPALSPDGHMLAYASDRAGQGNLDIWVQQTAGGMPIRLTDDPGDDDMPDFSPDGSQITFQSTRAGGGVYVVPTLGGTARLVAPGGRHPRFSPDGSRVVYWTGNFRGSMSGPGAQTFIVPLAGGTPAPVAPDFMVARDAVWSPDGRALLLVGRSKRDGPLAQTFDIWWVPLDGRAPVRTGIFDLRDIRNAADADRFSMGTWTLSGVMFSEDGTLWSQPISQTSGRSTGRPRLLASGAGLYSEPSVSRDGQLVFAMSDIERVIERLPLVDTAPTILPIRLYADGQSRSYRASQTGDGAIIVFERAAGRQREIWQKNTRTGAQQIVLPVKSDSQVNATVSQDGSRITFTIVDDRERAQTVLGSAYVVETAGGVPKPVCEKCGVYGFLSDNRRLLATVSDLRIRVLDVISGAVQDLVTTSKGRIDRPSLSPNERWLAFRHSDGAVGKIFVAPFTPGQPVAAEAAKEIDEPTVTGRPCGWSPDSTVLYLLLDADGSRDLWGQRIDPASGMPVGKPYVVRHLHGSSILGYSTSLGNAISAGGFLYEGATITGSIWRLTGAGTKK